MLTLNLLPDDLREVVRACAPVRITVCTPDYLQEFIACRLDEDNRDLAARVRGLDAEQMHALCEYIRSTQDLLS